MGNQWDTERHKKERIGVTKENNQGYIMKVIKYNNYNDIVVEFQDEFKGTKNSNWQLFELGNIKNPNQTALKHIGEEKCNKQGLHMTIKAYRSYEDIDVVFDNGYTREHVNYSEFKKGTTMNYMVPTVYGVGILGDVKTKINNKFTKEYSTWSNILQRCYDKKKHEEFPSYKESSICKEWLYYPNFVKWCHVQPNWDKVLENPKNFHIDKDIIVKGNKIYSPETCCFVPAIVNTIFCKSNAVRGDYPIGVSLMSHSSLFRARCNDPFAKKTIEHYGYITPEEAFEQYKKDKEGIIKKIAEQEYNKENITLQCYHAMMNYEVEITD